MTLPVCCGRSPKEVAALRREKGLPQTAGKGCAEYNSSSALIQAMRRLRCFETMVRTMGKTTIDALWGGELTIELDGGELGLVL